MTPLNSIIGNSHILKENFKKLHDFLKLKGQEMEEDPEMQRI